MKLLGQILLVCLLLSILKALVVLIAIGIVLLIIWGLFYRTPETVGLIAFCLLIEGLQVHPVATIGLVVFLSGALLIARSKPANRSSSKEPVALLPPPKEPPG